MPHAGPKSAVGSFFVLVALGAVGVVAALPVSLALVRDVLASLPDAPEFSPSATLALAFVNPLALVAIATLAGLVFAPRVGLRSLLAERAAGRPFDAHAWRAAFPGALAVGAAVGAVLVVSDRLTASLLVGELAGRTVTADRSLAVTVAGVLYGGVTEEIMLRWGLVARTVFLNALGGGAFGVLLWRRHLEAAMVAHATAHVVISLIAWVVPGV